MMSRLSLLDKLKVLGDVTSSSGMFTIVIIILIVLGILLITTNKKNKKTNKFACIAIYGSIIIVSLLFYKEQLFSLFDYMMNNFFIVIYFPNLAIYFAAIITTNIILWISVFNEKITKGIRTINTIMFCIMHYILILIINIITKNKLNIFDQTSIYQNKNALALIELSSTVFIVWILFLATYKIIRIYQENKIIENKDSLESITVPPIIEQPPKEEVIKIETVYKKLLPDSIIKTELPNVVYGPAKRKKEIEKEDNKEPSSIVDFMKDSVQNDNGYLMDIPNFITDETPQFLDIMLNNNNKQPKDYSPKEKEESKPKQVSKKPSKITITTQPLIVTKPVSTKKESSPPRQELDVFDNLLTLEDYKKVLALLKNYKKNEQQQASLEGREENKKISMNDFYQLIGKK